MNFTCKFSVDNANWAALSLYTGKCCSTCRRFYRSKYVKVETSEVHKKVPENNPLYELNSLSKETCSAQCLRRNYPKLLWIQHRKGIYFWSVRRAKLKMLQWGYNVDYPNITFSKTFFRDTRPDYYIFDCSYIGHSCKNTRRNGRPDKIYWKHVLSMAGNCIEFDPNTVRKGP